MFKYLEVLRDFLRAVPVGFGLVSVVTQHGQCVFFCILDAGKGFGAIG